MCNLDDAVSSGSVLIDLERTYFYLEDFYGKFGKSEVRMMLSICGTL